MLYPTTLAIPHLRRLWASLLGRGIRPPGPGAIPVFAMALNEPGSARVSAIEHANGDVVSSPSLGSDRKGPMVQVAVLAKPISDVGSAKAAPPDRPAKRPPRKAPIARRRQDEASRMRSIEQREQDAETLRRVQAGDGDAYRLLVQKYQQKVYGVVYGMVQNPEDAREITQDAFIKAFRSLDRFRFDASFYTWLYRITVNLTIDFRRRMAKRRADEFDETRMQKDEAGGAAHGHVEASPSRRLERKRLADRIQAAIDQLPADQRTAIMLRELEGLSYKEIAETMECAEGTVMSRLFYGRKKLQEILRDVR